ncbi:hypothetical protein [Cytobacillus purgationiresistens]|uniref:Uncharacterized protein n=1 Tax=Cytobacillus purgationiresistens TaxID=863449 RepID=A0ABU0ACA2_9BACI|nr:hypothetical protein [Cytobacillus purgationiresistens]MDQ0268887.1 hypothetical protein [Cytobacillus purgationiresistens]
MKKFLEKYLEWILMILLILCMIIIIGSLLFFIFDLDVSIIAGLIGFVGTIIGGIITYLGVKLSLKHRDKELFLQTATKKMIELDKIYPKYKAIADEAFICKYDIAFNEGTPKRLQSLLEKYIAYAEGDIEVLYSVMEYYDIQSFKAYLTEMRFLSHKNIETTNFSTKEAIKVINDCTNLFLKTEFYLKKNYDKYKTKEGEFF